ncbi:cof family protein [Streptococcus pneumoniae]|nr:cof family protein [Streptococcus pneumoniae]
MREEAISVGLWPWPVEAAYSRRTNHQFTLVVLIDIVHQANMGKIFPDGKAHFDPVTHKILKPDNWEEKYAPEPAIKKELQRQLKAYERHKERNKS